MSRRVWPLGRILSGAVVLLGVACADDGPKGGDTNGGHDTADTADTAETADTGDSPVDSTDDSDTADTHGETDDSPVDTGPPPLRVDVYGPLLMDGACHALSVGPDATVWIAGNAGLVHLDPDSGTSRTYTSADGLLTDAPLAVLAAGDGTVWVGHAGDAARQGEQVAVQEDGSVALVQPIDFTLTEEETTIYRLREQPYGDGAGDVWMGANEGAILYDASLGLFLEHAHPTHPHGATMGLAFHPDAGDVWNLDQYQLSRWAYGNDGALSSVDDLVDYRTVWPVEVEETIAGADADEADGVLWLASAVFGVARVEIGDVPDDDVTELLATPPTAAAVRVGPDGTVWAGGPDGLYAWDGAAFVAVTDEALPAGGVTQLAAGTDGIWVAKGANVVHLVGDPFADEALR